MFLNVKGRKAIWNFLGMEGFFSQAHALEVVS